MPRFEPFAGLRYDTARVNLSMVVAPPFDVVEPEERKRLAGQHSANAIRVELPEADHKAGLNPYEHAAAQLDQWQELGTLVREASPAFYAYRMTTPDGQATTGVIGALGLEPASAEQILPHEQTLPKPKSDRLDLLRATRANISPIWGLSLTAGLTDEFRQDRPPDASAVDPDGVQHDLWVISDPRVIAAVSSAVAASPVVLADGHHRFQTALTYRDELIGEAGPPPNGESVDPGSDLVMAFVVELSPEELAVRPIHRALTGLPPDFDVVAAFGEHFVLTRIGDFDERSLRAVGESGALALLTRDGTWLMTPNDDLADLAGADLDSAMVAVVLGEIPEHEMRFKNSWSDAGEAVRSGEFQAAVLLRAVTIDQIEAWAHDRRRMPPKSTLFYPKPRTGMVYRTLDEPDA
jgi:uncharacterized protein (DUF1015 family)